MANQLKMAMVHAILTLTRLGWSQRRIAQELEVDRETVARYVHSPPAEAEPATNPIPGSEAAEPSCPGKSPGPESLSLYPVLNCSTNSTSCSLYAASAFPPLA